MALPLTRMRGPGMRPSLMALRTAESAEPAPSVPMSRSAMKPAIRSALAASVARIVRFGTDSSTVCRSFGPGVQEQMHVRVDESRQKSDVAKIDNLRSGGTVCLRANFYDAFVLDQHTTRADDLSTRDVEHACCTQDNRGRWGL